MKSHQYASKRRLTNICCLVVSLAFIKLVFAAYVMAGGELFEFSSERKDYSPKAAIIAHAQKQSLLGESSMESAAQVAISGEVANTVPVSNSRVSFFPKGQKNDNFAAHNSSTHTQTSMQGTQAVAEKPSVQNEVKYIERSDRVNSDMVLAQASATTANLARAQMREGLLQAAFEQNKKYDLNTLEELDGAQTPHYVSQAPAARVQETQTVRAQEPKKEKSSFFSFVGTANAAEEPYVRPDQKTSANIPPPTIAPYASPESLDYKRAELNRKEEELLALQQQMNARMEELNAIEGRIGSMVQGGNNMQSDKFKHLIGTYTSMKAKKAAQALVSLDEEIAVRILNGMKPKQSGEIFSYMDPTQAARLSTAMSEMQM